VVARNLAASNPVRRVKLFHDDNSRLRYLSREEYDRLLKVAGTIETSPYLEEKIILAIHTGLRCGSLFNLRWDQIDFANRVMRISRTKSGRPLSLPMNATNHLDASDASRSWRPYVTLRLPAHSRPEGRRADSGHQERVSQGAGAR